MGKVSYADGTRAKEHGNRSQDFPVRPLIVLALVQITTASDNCLLGIAASAIMNEYHASYNDVQMATMAYAMVAGAFMIAGGLLGLKIGWRRTLRLGIALAIAGEAVLVLSTSIDAFIWGGRMVVGLGASLVTPSVLGLIPAYYRGHDRLVAFGFVAAATGFATLAPIPFGLLLDAAGLRPAFTVLLVMFVVVLAASVVLPDPGKPDMRLKIDYAGIMLAAIGLALFMIGASRISSWGVVAPLDACPFTLFGISPSLPMIGLGLAVLAVFWRVEGRVEARGETPVIPRAFVKTARTRAGLLAVGVPYMYMGAQSIVMTPYIQLVGGLTATQTGLLALLSGVPMMLFSMMIPRWMPQARPRAVIRVGYLVIATAALVMAFSLDTHGINGMLFVAVFLAGSGMGLVNSHANNAVASSVGPREAQQSGGIQGTARNLGTALGTAIMGTMLLLSLGLVFALLANETPGIDNAERSALSQITVTFMGDESLSATLSEKGVDSTTTAELTEVNAQARMLAARATLITLSLVVLICCAAGTRAIDDARPDPSPH